jgi:CRP-like cAMP-binding protein
MVSADELAAVPLFSSLTEADREELACWFDEQTAGEGIRLCGEGAAGYSFFVVKNGSAVVTADGRDLATLGPGDFFGEIAILGDGRRSATVTTTSRSTVFVLFGTEFRRLQQTHPALAAELEDAMRRRLGAQGQSQN